MDDRQFVLVAGVSRSGTSLLSSLIETQLDVAIPIDTMTIPVFYPYLFLWGDIGKSRNRKMLISAMMDFTKIWLLFAASAKDPVRMFEMSVVPELAALHSSDAENISSYPELIDRIYSLFAARLMKRFKGEHSTTLRSVRGWEGSAPRMKVVHIIRDGRDVCLSWVKEWFGPASAVDAALRWRRHIKAVREWGKRNPDRYIEVHYERLVADPNEELKRIAGFIGSQFTATERVRADGKLAQTYVTQGYHPLLEGGMVRDNVKKWMRQMPVTDRQLFELYAGDTLKDCGYQIPTGVVSFPRNMLIRALFLFYFIARFFSIKFCRYWIRAVVPPVIWLTQIFRMSITSVLGVEKRYEENVGGAVASLEENCKRHISA